MALADPNYTRLLWEERIAPYWSHRNRPAGQRFLGSVCTSKGVAEELWRVIGVSLRRLSSISYHNLEKEFYDPKRNWLKILTFAISEYAYYCQNDGGFWQGWQSCLNLTNRSPQGITKAFQRVIEQGTQLLGLVKARGGYRYVSPLWLQSGIPQQNLDHFARLLQEVSHEWDWWELAHTSSEDLSHILLDFCRNRHEQWGTLINFLKASCSDDESEVEPISGQLVQGLAIVALELERQGRKPSDLGNNNEREKLLKHYYLPQNFFLRNWDTLIQVLTPKMSSRTQRQAMVSQRKKPLSLVLDIDSFNIELWLPEQQLWKSEWNNLRGTFCEIPEINWENCFPNSGGLLIPEKSVTVTSVSERWSCQLRDNCNRKQAEWTIQGVDEEAPYLVFDAWDGNRLTSPQGNQSQFPPEISGSLAIFCFVPKGAKFIFSSGIEVIDSYVPCSISGWLGQQLRLKTQTASITIANADKTITLNWRTISSQQSALSGLKLKGKKSIYLEIPTFWYLPNSTSPLNVVIEDLNHLSYITPPNQQVLISSKDCWQSIPLNQWITESGSYEARFWNELHRWSYNVEVRLSYELPQQIQVEKLRTKSRSQGLVEILPIKCDSLEKFLAEEITIEGLWILERVIFRLLSRHDNTPYVYVAQADTRGRLELDLARFNGVLPDPDDCALEYQRSGLETQRLVETTGFAPSISWTWAAQSVHFSGLEPDQPYFLNCWNLLTPEAQPVEIEIPPQNQDTATIPLELPGGIYHVQLQGRALQSLGCWCGSKQNALPDAATDNDDLANYCYTILGNEPVADFLEASANLDIEEQRIKAIISSLQDGCCCFPVWLNQHSLLEKLQALLQHFNHPIERGFCQQKTIDFLTIKTPIYSPSEQFVTAVDNVLVGNWYLLRTQYKKRNLFLVGLETNNKTNNYSSILQPFFLEYSIPKDPLYEDLVLIRLSNYQAAYLYLREVTYFQELERRPLPLEQANKMLGPNDRA